jgi:hypothetical protein
VDAYIVSACESLEANIRETAQTALEDIRRQLAN